jgi:hypothetical protein
MILKNSFPVLALAAAASLVIAGCASKTPTAAPDTASVAAAPAPATPPAPPRLEAPKGPPLSSAQVAQLVRNARGNVDKMSAELVGRLVSAKVVQVKDSVDYFAVRRSGDPVWFWCEGESFAGGQVHAQITDVSLVADAKPQQAIVKLDRCGAPAATAKAAPAAMPAASPAPAALAAAAAAAPAAAAANGAGKPGMDAQGNVVDSSKVESGSGRTVKGINDYEGEITGNPAPSSKFTQLQIGMPMRQVTDLIGQPTDQGAYMTGKAWIPFYFGSDRHRFEMVYKGQGRLIFAGGGLGDFSSGNLIWIIHNPNEGGYR